MINSYIMGFLKRSWGGIVRRGFVCDHDWEIHFRVDETVRACTICDKEVFLGFIHNLL